MDNTQICLSINPDEYNQFIRLQSCLKDMQTWMTLNFLLLKLDKSKIVVFLLQKLQTKLSSFIINLDGINLASSSTVRKLGVIFGQDFSINLHIKQVYSNRLLPST